MERLPLVEELADPEGADVKEMQANFEDLGGAPVQQPARSSKWWRAAAAIFVLGAVATVIAAGPIHNQIVADAGHPEQMWSISGAWQTVKDTASQAHEAVSSAVSEHWSNLKGFLDSNLAEETKLYLADKIESLKNSGQWAQDQAQNALCGMRDHLADLKQRLANKMTHDFFDRSSPCGIDFQSMECRQACVDDACKDVPPLHGGSSTEIAGIDLDNILNAPKNLCTVVFTDIVTHIQRKLREQGEAIQGMQGMQSATKLKNSIDAKMGEVDAEFAKVCG